ncbi:uncharacterized protein ACA1_296400 [Acanthamoeba castellanii str. Neff]|uniref:Uncharacterized protein n=1 Tax=Acanthamoeba castellanii (strain ATCC 30010 / Neff) TaxID=1257118 RepID=L8HK13_ACACF|nr:uncharacterized protein ACA1_296400 [Acanthamoeba castellanii str. Neff]ELR25542.1 hypothetical protein ACA1_296400 [Acanthamoeba castellanii str. Neff]
MPQTTNPVALYDCPLLVGGLCLSHQAIGLAALLVIFALLATFIHLVRSQTPAPRADKKNTPTTSPLSPPAPVDLLATIEEEAEAREEDQEDDEFLYGTPHEVIQRPLAGAEATATDHNNFIEEEEEYAYDAFFSIPSSADGTPNQRNANEGDPLHGLPAPSPSSSPSSSKPRSPTSSSSSSRRAPCPRCRRPVHLPCFHSTDVDRQRLTSPKLNFRGEKVTDPYACNYCGLPNHFFNQCPHRVV